MKAQVTFVASQCIENNLQYTRIYEVDCDYDKNMQAKNIALIK